MNYLPRLASNLDLPDLSLPSNEDYRHEPHVQQIVQQFEILKEWKLNNLKVGDKSKKSCAIIHTQDHFWSLCLFV
jgi:hypothetical protein